MKTLVRMAVLLGMATAGMAQGEEPVDFAREVLPLLSNSCFACHGPDEEDRAADLRLDTPEGMQSVLAESTDDDPLKSEFIHRITTSDPDDLMPPPDKKDALSPEEVALLKRWVSQGATWGTHWAFEAPIRPDLPLPETGKPGHPIDNFVTGRLQEAELVAAGSAPRAKLLRRLSLDLIGLPPTLGELDAFLADQSDQAWEKQIQRLLDSPHFGERWARWWMDAARYADSNGYEKDSVRYVWPYRDWLIEAYNRNLPYDQFIIKQVGGDLLPGATLSDRVATGFLRNSMVNEEGAIKYEQFRVEGIFDRVDAIGKSILGITTTCAQCHTHKYDPLSHEEYFGIYAYLNNVHESTVPYFTSQQRHTIQGIEQQIDEIRQRAMAVASAQPAFAEWVKQRRAEIQQEPEWVVVTPDLLGDGGQKFYPKEDGSLISMGYSPARSAERFAGQTTMQTIASLRLELIQDPYLTYSGPGRSIEGSAALSELKLFAGSDPANLAAVKFQAARSDLDPPSRPIDAIKYPQKDASKPEDRTEGPAAYATDGDVKTAWATEAGPDRTNQPRVLVVNLEEPLAREGAEPIHLRFELHCQHGGWNSNDNQHRNLGRFRFSFSEAAWPDQDPVNPRVRAILEKKDSAWSKAERKELQLAWIESKSGLPPFAQQIAETRSEHPSPTPQLVVQERIRDPRITRLFHRGDQQHPRQEVQPHTPAFLHPLPERSDPESRLTFAHWLVDRDSPTTARTLVNRTWQAFFGAGIVETVDDLGRQATQASHPDLLDWLAVEFMESGWDFKKLLHLIVTSDTYRRDSTLRPGDGGVDPRNRLLARGPRFRPDAEIVRDTQLAVSGLLDRSVGGDSVRPPIPEFLFLPPASYGYKTWNEDTTPAKRYRRALYTFRFRTVPPPFLAAFDAPTGEVSCVRRPYSTTPLQALATLNEPLSLEAAQALAAQMEQETRSRKSLSSSIGNAFRQCTSRNPDARELEVLLQLHQREEDQNSGSGFLAVARVLLNLDETLVKS